MFSLDRFARDKLARLDAEALRRSPVASDRAGFPHVVQGGRRLLSFSCNDYLGMSVRREVIEAAVRATQRYGAGAGASRLVTGNSALHDALEDRLASAKGTEAACVFGSGYLANIGVLGVFAGPEDLVLVDDLAHACLMAGAQLSRAAVLRFRHNDAAHAADLLGRRRAHHRHALLVTETVFSMDGDRAPLPRLAALASEHDAWLMTDDAHGFATVPDDGSAVALRMGTLSKALGSYGGYCCASRPAIDLLKTRARSLVYTTGLPPAPLAAALAALDLIDADPDLAELPLRKARLFTDRLGIAEAASPIVPLVIGQADATLAASAQLREAGFLVTAIRPPTVPPGTARLRVAFCALHTDEDVIRLADAIGRAPWWTRGEATAQRDTACPAFS